VQRYVTTRTPDSNFRIGEVKRTMLLGAPAHFVRTDHPAVHVISSAS
jgi:hypothetical protein